MFAGNFAPAGWMFCDGALLPIAENETLFQLIGTTYGGDGQSTFALPNLQGRLPIHQGQGPGLSNHVLAETGGAEQITLTVQQIAAHAHEMLATNAPAADTNPGNGVLGKTLVNISAYGTDAPLTPLIQSAVSPAGGSQPHDNMQPYLCVNFIISLFGIFPSPT